MNWWIYSSRCWSKIVFVVLLSSSRRNLWCANNGFALNTHVRHLRNRQEDRIAMKIRKIDYLSILGNRISRTSICFQKSVFQITLIRITCVPHLITKKKMRGFRSILLTHENYRSSPSRKINITPLIDLPNVIPMTFLSPRRENITFLLPYVLCISIFFILPTLTRLLLTVSNIYYNVIFGASCIKIIC